MAALVRDVLGFDHLAVGDLLPPAPDNPHGFFESQRLIALNDRLLSLIGADWSRPPLIPSLWTSQHIQDCISSARSDFASYVNTAYWVDKDPRLCITFPAVQRLVLRRDPILVVVRSPLHVAFSLHLRNGFSVERGLWLWFLYNFHLASSLRDDDVLVTYDQLLAASEDQEISCHLFGLIEPVLSAVSTRPVRLEQWQLALNRRLTPNLNRSSSVAERTCSATRIPAELQQIVETAYSRACAGAGSFTRAFAIMPTYMLRLADEYQFAAPFIRDHLDLQRLRLEVCQLRERANSLESRLHAIESSTIWQFTAPLRRLRDRRRS
jgi:hypothetical protein